MEQQSASIFRPKLSSWTVPLKASWQYATPNTGHYLAADTCNIPEDLSITEQ